MRFLTELSLKIPGMCSDLHQIVNNVISDSDSSFDIS